MIISLINKNVNILNKILQHLSKIKIIKIIYQYEWLHTRDINIVQHTNIRQNNRPCKLIERQNLRIIPLDARNVFDKKQHPAMIKVLERIETQGTYLNINEVYIKPIAILKLKGGNIKEIALESGTRSRHNDKISEGNQVGIYWKRRSQFIFICS